MIHVTQMAKPRSPKLKLNLPTSFRICHPKKPSSMARSPTPKLTFIFSPDNCKSHDISFPGFPDAPPSTPSMINPFESTLQTCGEARNREKLFESPVSSASDETPSLVAASRNGKRNDANVGKELNVMNKSYENDDGLFSSSPGFNSSYDNSNHPFNVSKKPVQQTCIRQQRFKHTKLKERNHGDEYHEKKSIISSRLVPCMRDAKVNDSFVVVKKSVDPYEDFKNSMLEMILEKQIFEPKELEHLLMSFLSLNSRIHHEVIIDAFPEIMNSVFC